MTNDGSTTQTRSTNTEPITAVTLAIEHISEIVSSVAVRSKRAERKGCCGRFDCKRIDGAGVVRRKKPDADPSEQTRRQKTSEERASRRVRWPLHYLRATAASPRSVNWLGSVRMISGLRCNADLLGDADLHVDRLSILLRKGYRRRKDQSGSHGWRTSGDLLNGCCAIGRKPSMREVFPGMMKSTPGCWAKTGRTAS